ncbi:MAG TPA: serine/threonine-protein kinase, partial [Actinomycetota bacterium]|nr:serine/threonine-protein kinase [Actinomycetota bacterium]
EARGRLPWTEAFALAEQVARALAAAHAHRLVHRDVKPGNILIGPGERAKVTDFGIAKAAASATLTRTGMVLGSANYVAPEQAAGDSVGPAADQYSLGCVLFEAVTGRTPYAGKNPVAIATQHVSAPVPDPRQLRRDLPVPAARLIRRALAKAPRDRFASATAMADELAAVASGRSGAPARRSSWWALGAGTLVGMTSLLLAWPPRGPSDPPAGQPARQLAPHPTVDNGDEDD